MRLKKTDVSDKILNKISKIRIFNQKQDYFDCLKIKRLMNRKFQNATIRLIYISNELKNRDNGSAGCNYSYTTICHNETSVSITSYNVKLLIVKSEPRLVYSMTYKAVINKRNMAKSFINKKGILPSRVFTILGLDWMHPTLRDNAFAANERIFFQCVRGYITNNKTLFQYYIELVYKCKVKSSNKLFKTMFHEKNEFSYHSNLAARKGSDHVSINNTLRFLATNIHAEKFINDPAQINLLISNHSLVSEYLHELNLLNEPNTARDYDHLRKLHSKNSAIINEITFNLNNVLKIYDQPEIVHKEFKILRTNHELFSEGKSMNHCVGGSTYMNRSEDGTGIIIHYEDSNSSMEGTADIRFNSLMNTYNVYQFYGFGNDRLDQIHHDKLDEYLKSNKDVIVGFFIRRAEEKLRISGAISDDILGMQLAHNDGMAPRVVRDNIVPMNEVQNWDMNINALRNNPARIVDAQMPYARVNQ